MDTDVIVSEEPPAGSTRKPEELYGIIERFSQVRRGRRCGCLCTVAAVAAVPGFTADPGSPFILRSNVCAYLCSQALYICVVSPAFNSRALTGTDCLLTPHMRPWHVVRSMVVRYPGLVACGWAADAPGRQGRRRLELFGEDHNIRPGWVTVGRDLSGSNFSPQARVVHAPALQGLR